MGTALRVVLALAAIGVLIWLFRPRAELVVLIRGGKPEVRRGKVSGRVLQDWALICRDWGIREGTIRGVRVGRDHVSLRFSREIAPEHHQRFRNAWGVQG
ncbi:MAG: DUF3634 family protein [Planctomycetes bacterium]|nr:DUF3634 family protein [Planctomycetota bacterium]